MKTIDIHGKPYVMVKDRVEEFHKEYPNGSIRTELIEMTDRFIIKATIIPDVEEGSRYFTGHAEEIIGSTQINKTSALENCETSAIGRALGSLNIGIIDSFASADEVANAVIKQNTQNSPKTAENGLKCEKCGSGMLDNKTIDGQPKKSNNYDKFKAEGKTRGLYQPLYRCENSSCKHGIWDEPVKEEAPPKKQENLEGVEDIELEKIPF